MTPLFRISFTSFVFIFVLKSVTRGCEVPLGHCFLLTAGKEQEKHMYIYISIVFKMYIDKQKQNGYRSDHSSKILQNLVSLYKFRSAPRVASDHFIMLTC